MIEYGIIIQARMGSTRRPKKVAYKVSDDEMLTYQIKRMQANGIENIIVATTQNPEDDVVEEITLKQGAKIFRGSENNLIERFYGAAVKYNVKNIIRVGGDDPFIDPDGIRAIIKAYEEKPADFIYASHRAGWIYGTAVELIPTATFKVALEAETTKFEREHTMPYLKRNEAFSYYKLIPENPKIRRPDIYLSVDYEEDLDVISQICTHFAAEGKLYTFTQEELVELYDSGKLDIKNRHLHEGFDID